MCSKQLASQSVFGSNVNSNNSNFLGRRIRADLRSSCVRICPKSGPMTFAGRNSRSTVSVAFPMFKVQLSALSSQLGGQSPLHRLCIEPRSLTIPHTRACGTVRQRGAGFAGKLSPCWLVRGDCGAVTREGWRWSLTPVPEPMGLKSPYTGRFGQGISDERQVR